MPNDITSTEMQKVITAFEFVTGFRCFWELTEGEILLSCHDNEKWMWSYRAETFKKCILFILSQFSNELRD